MFEVYVYIGMVAHLAKIVIAGISFYKRDDPEWLEKWISRLRHPFNARLRGEMEFDLGFESED